MDRNNKKLYFKWMDSYCVYYYCFIKIFKPALLLAKTAEKIILFIDNAVKKLWFVDLAVGIIGILFLYLGLWIY